MKIGMQTWGSHGDIRPFLALAEGLQAAGNDVHLLITCVDSDAYRDMVSAAGVKITLVASPVLTPEQQENIGRTAYAIRNPMTQMKAILRLCLEPVEDAMFDAARRLCAESDVLIGHYFLHPLQTAAEAAGRPYVSVLLSHAGVPSDFDHPLTMPGAGKIVHRLLWWLTRTLLNRGLKHYPDRLRAQLGMAPVRDVVTQIWLSQHLTLVAVSPTMCEARPDWPASAHVCGFLDMPNLAMEGQLSPDLAAFLAAGDAPVYMTFGSWMPRDFVGQTKALRLLTEAARQAGYRAIIQAPSAAACGFQGDGNILYVAAAPHHVVFPRCRAIVHHGGAGTTQSAMRAGTPSVVVANISEQEHWGKELRRLGIGGKPAKRRNVTAAALATRIRDVLAAPAMTVRAAQIADAMAAERGVDAAVALVMRTFAPRQADAAAVR
jgi:sterol 3beta-glucosyltransferase